MVKRLLVIAGLVAGWTLIAPAQERHVLNFEVVKNGAVVARPVLRVNDGAEAALALDALDVKFTPTRVAADRLVIAFDITSGGTTVRPRVTLLRDEPGALTLPAGSGRDAYELRFALAPPAP